MRKLIAGIILGTALLCGTKAHAQYNREYFFWVGRSCMMNNDYQEAIRTLNTLLRFDEDAFEGYFLRGIAKYNLDDLLGAEDDFSTAIRLNPVYTQAYTYRAMDELIRSRETVEAEAEEVGDKKEEKEDEKVDGKEAAKPKARTAKTGEKQATDEKVEKITNN